MSRSISRRLRAVPSDIHRIPERIGELLTMLTYMRPAGSASEVAFIREYITPTGAAADEFGNYWLTIGDAPILWSSHTDTVHNHSGKQAVTYGDGYATLNYDAKALSVSNCLGADCTVGVWLMLHMIRAGVEGTYVFHRSEEIGGLGSSYIANECPDRLDGMFAAIAFDRAGSTRSSRIKAGNAAPLTGSRIVWPTS